MQISDQKIDEFYSDERRHDPTETIQEQVPPQEGGCAYGPILHASKRQGISAIMISALKMTADRIADCGVARPITLSTFSWGNAPANMAGIIAKYFATSFATENVVSAPRVISNCLPISTISISFVGFESRSTMLPASLAACVPVFIATPTSACANAGASLVPSPVIATSLPLACSRLISAILSSGRASARKSSTPA